MITVKNISGQKLHFGFGRNHRGVTLENNATATIQAKDVERYQEVLERVADHVDAGTLSVVAGPESLLAIKNITAHYTLTAADSGSVIQVDSTGASVEVRIPDDLPINFRCDVIQIDGATNTTTIKKLSSGSAVVTSKGSTAAAPVLDADFKAASIYRDATITASETYRVIGDVS